jgi:hypothetical protein
MHMAQCSVHNTWPNYNWAMCYEQSMEMSNNQSVSLYILHNDYTVFCYIYVTLHKGKGKGHPITGHEGPTGGVEV